MKGDETEWQIDMAWTGKNWLQNGTLKQQVLCVVWQ